MYNGVSPIRLFKAARDVSNHCLTGFAAVWPPRRSRLRRPRARNRQYFFRPRAASASNIPMAMRHPTTKKRCRNCPGRLLPTPNRPLPPGRAHPAGCGASQPLAPPPGTTSFRRIRHQPRGGAPPTRASRSHRRSQRAAGLPPGNAAKACRSRRDAAARRRVVSEPPAQKIVNKKASFSARQDHRTHHQLR